MRGSDEKVNSLLETYSDPINDKIIQLVDGYKEWSGSMNVQELRALEQKVEELALVYKEEREKIINWREEFLARRIREICRENEEKRDG